MFAIVAMNDPSAMGFMDVYDPGDVWMKVQGCDACITENNCCGNCAARAGDKCSLHILNGGSKPYDCVVRPSPIEHNSNCALVFECTCGKFKGQFRWKADPQSVFRVEGP